MHIKNGFKILVHSDGFLSSLLLSMLLFMLGVIQTLIYDAPIVGYLCLTSSGLFISLHSSSLSMTESIAASPLRKTIEVYIPNILIVFSVSISYILLCVFTWMKSDATSSFYTLTSIYDTYYYFFLGAYFIGLSIILIPIINKMKSAIPVFIILAIIGRFIIYVFIASLYDESTAPINLTAIYIIGFLFIGLCLRIAFECTSHFYKKLFVNGIIRITNMRWIFKKLIPICALSIFVAVGLSTYILQVMYIKYEDGWYTKDALKERYRELMVDCDEQLQFGDYTITLAKQYYDSTTEDACCMFRIEANDEAIAYLKSEFNNIDDNLNAFREWDYGTSFSFGYCRDDHEWRSVATALVDGSGIIDIEHEYDPHNNRILYVYMYMNMMPRNDSDELSIYFVEGSVYENQDNYLYSSVYDDNYNGDVWKKFTLTDTTENIIVEKKNTQISISPSGLLCYAHIDPSTLSIVMTDGSELPIVENSNLIKGYERYENSQYVKYNFNDVIDISKVKDIRFDGSFTSVPTDCMNYMCTETYNMKQTIFTEPYENNRNIVKVTMNIQWTNMPKYRRTDYIVFPIYGAVDYYENVNISHKVYEVLNNDRSTGHWVEALYKETDDSVTSIGIEDYYLPSIQASDITPNTYSNFRVLRIYPTLCVDSNKRTYTNACWTIEMDIEVSGDGYKTPSISCIYTHHKDDVAGKIYAGQLTDPAYSGIVGCRFNYQIYPY